MCSLNASYKAGKGLGCFSHSLFYYWPSTQTFTEEIHCNLQVKVNHHRLLPELYNRDWQHNSIDKQKILTQIKSLSFCMQCRIVMLFHFCMMTMSVCLCQENLFHLCQSFLYNVNWLFPLYQVPVCNASAESKHTHCRSSFTDIFQFLWCIHTSVWNVTLICMLTISREITPSWLMVTLLPQKPPWAMWYDSPIIRHQSIFL